MVGLPMYKKSMLVLLILLAVVGGGMLYGSYTQEQVVTLDAAESKDKTDQAAAITVYVTGAVNKPGVVTVNEGARTADAVNACGGLLPTADKEHVNMAQVLKDGQQVKVPERSGDTAKPAEGKPGGKADGSGKVNINTADEKELDTLPGIGPAMAKRIIEYRETEGSFQQIEDIKKIRGIGEAKFSKMKDKLCI